MLKCFRCRYRTSLAHAPSERQRKNPTNRKRTVRKRGSFTFCELLLTILRRPCIIMTARICGRSPSPQTAGRAGKLLYTLKNKWTKVISMWVLIYAFLGFLYFLASTWKPIFSTIGIEAMFPIYTFINIFASFCIYFYHDFRKEPCKNKWYKFVLGNLLTVVLFVGLFFGYAVFALHDM